MRNKGFGCCGDKEATRSSGRFHSLLELEIEKSSDTEACLESSYKSSQPNKCRVDTVVDNKILENLDKCKTLKNYSSFKKSRESHWRDTLANHKGTFTELLIYASTENEDILNKTKDMTEKVEGSNYS